MIRTAFCLLLALSLTLSAANKKVVTPKGWPTSPNYSAGVLIGDTLYVSGQVGQDRASGKVPEDFDAEVKQTLENVGAVLKEAGFDYSDAVSVQVYLTDMSLFQRMNAVYTTYFKEPRPTRTTVGVAKLVGASRIEITVTARK
jgi:2-iminobutanoate/2-iminopropanoate deaminase